MVQDVKGIDSGCICPVCFTKCTSCTDNNSSPMNKETIKLMFENYNFELPNSYDDEDDRLNYSPDCSSDDSD